MVHMMMMMMMMHMVMHVMMRVRPGRSGHHPRDRGRGTWGGGLRGGTSGSASYCVLRKSVTREADRENGGGDKALNHWKSSLLKTPTVPTRDFPIICLNPA